MLHVTKFLIIVHSATYVHTKRDIDLKLWKIK